VTAKTDAWRIVMNKKTKIAVAAGILAGAVAVPAFAAGGDDAGEKDVPITGSDLDKASAAALQHLGQGRVTETEVGDEESYYEVEVTLDDGSQVDVQLDESFNVVGTENEEDDLHDD
jgi:uncharacterized membrane protein YkoI